MKKFLTFCISILLMLISGSTLYAQKMMKLDEDLKASSVPVEAKRKGVGTVGKYEFGNYKIISGKAGWEWQPWEWDWGWPDFTFGIVSNSESKARSSFVFVAGDKDTILVVTATNSKTRATNLGLESYISVSWINESTENYYVAISSIMELSNWSMMLVTKSGTVVDGKYTAQGILTNGITNIEIREVKLWEDGKSPAFGLICGYEFYHDNKAVAAVQSCLDTTKKKFVWLHKDLDENIKSILAAFAASLMVHTDQEQASMN